MTNSETCDFSRNKIGTSEEPIDFVLETEFLSQMRGKPRAKSSLPSREQFLSERKKL
jgi:hypothetical protein